MPRNVQSGEPARSGKTVLEGSGFWLSYDPEEGQWQAGRTGCEKPEVLGGWTINREAVTSGAGDLSVEQGRVRWSRVDGLEYTWTAGIDSERGALTFRLMVRNGTDQSFRLRHFSPFSGAIWSPEAWDVTSLRLLDGRCGGGETKVCADGTLTSENNFLATSGCGDARRSLVTGGLCYRDFATYTEANEEPGLRGLRFTVEACDAVGRLVEPGELYNPEDAFYLDFAEPDPFEALEKYGLAVREATGARPNAYTFPTVCGWYASMRKYGGGPFINDTVGMVDEAEAARDVGLTRYTPVACRLVPDTYDVALGERIKVERFHPSILSEDRNTEQGWWDEVHWQKFGHLREPYETLDKWSSAMEDRGGIPFMYLQPGNASQDYIQQFPGHFLNNDISRIDEPFGQLPNVQLDYTDPEFQQHMRSVWDTMRKGGVRGVMFDYPHYCWHEGGGFDNPKATTTSAYRAVFELAREGLGPDAYLHERNVKRDWKHYVDVCVGLVDSQRVIGDTDIVTPEIISRCALRWYKNRVLYALDTDAKHFHKVVPADRDGQRQMLTLLYVVSGRFMFGHTTRWLKLEMVHDTSRCFPMHTEPRSARPLDAFSRDGCPRIFDYRVNDDWHQLTLFNDDMEESRCLTVELGTRPADGGMGLDPSSQYYAYDFWNDALRGIFRGDSTLEQELRPGEARMLSVRRKKDHPQVISTDRHLMQGLVDLFNEQWETDGNCLSGESRVVEGEVYRLRLANNGFVPETVSANGASCWLEGEPWRNAYTTVCLLSDKSGSVTWKIDYKPNNENHVPADSGNLGSWEESGEGAWMDHVQTGILLSGEAPLRTGDPRFERTVRATGSGAVWEFSDREGCVDLKLHWRPCGSRGVSCQLEVINRSGRTLLIDALEVCRGRLVGDGKFGKVIPNSYWVGYRTAEERLFVPEPERNYNTSYWTLTVESPALAAGFLTGLHNVNRFGLKRIGNDLEVLAWAECDGVELSAGATRISDELFLSAGSNALAEMERFGDLAGQRSGARAREDAFATWCSWYSGWMGRQAQQYISKWKGGLETGVEAQINPIARLLGKRRGNWMRVVDDSRSMSIGDWDDQTIKIPGGYRRLAHLMRDAGIQPGVWITPFYVGVKTRLFQEHPEYLVRDKSGEVFLPGYAGIDCGLLDSTVPGAEKLFENMAETWRERGYTYVMTDFLRSQLFAPCFNDRTQTPIEAHRKALEALRRGFGDSVYWLGCTALPGPCMGLVDAFRISGDSFGGITKKGGPFAYTQSAYRWFYHRRVWLNDPDSVITRGYWDFKNREYVRESHPAAYRQAYFSWIALAGLAVTYGDTFDDLPEDNLDVYRKTFPPLPITGRPLDIWEHDPHYLWGVVPSENPEHPVLVGAFALFEKEPVRLRLNIQEAVRRCHGFDTPVGVPESFRVWDFWNERGIPVQNGVVEMELAPGSGCVMGVSLVDKRPRLVSSTGHFSQGSLEAPDLHWSPAGDGGYLKGNVHANGADAGALVISIPSECGPAHVRLDGKPANLDPLGGDLYRLNLQASEVPLAFELAVDHLPETPKMVEAPCSASIVSKTDLPLSRS